MTRGRGKFKQKRGGGRTFSRNLVLNEDGIAVEADKWYVHLLFLFKCGVFWARSHNGNHGRSRRDRGDDDDEDDEDENSDEKGKKIEESDEESEEEEEDQPEGAAAGPSVSVEQSRAERRAEKRQRKQPQAVAEEDQDLVNPNRLPVKAMAISDIAAPRELSRRERYA